jgi:copper chaperone CopZ
MTHIYTIDGMTCNNCRAQVRSLLSRVEGVKNIAIDLSKNEAIIEMDKHIPTSEFQTALQVYPKYKLTENGRHQHNTIAIPGEESRSWLETYKPIVLVFGYILGVTLLIEVVSGAFVWTRWMDHFMAGFFLVFSFFKILNLGGFAESYSTYDIVAKKWPGWSYLYVFIELALGIAFLTGFNPQVTNGVTFVVMSVSLVGVLQTVMNKRKIKCACLGTVFNLPMSSVTIIEDALMILMSLIMLLTLTNA